MVAHELGKIPAQLVGQEDVNGAILRSTTIEDSDIFGWPQDKLVALGDFIYDLVIPGFSRHESHGFENSELWNKKETPQEKQFIDLTEGMTEEEKKDFEMVGRIMGLQIAEESIRRSRENLNAVGRWHRYESGEPGVDQTAAWKGASKPNIEFNRDDLESDDFLS